MVAGGLVGMALQRPARRAAAAGVVRVAVAFGSATQDIALDAFRIESAGTRKQAALAAAYQTGYRLAMIWAGAGVLWVAAWAELDGRGGLSERRLENRLPGDGRLDGRSACSRCCSRPSRLPRAFARPRTLAEWLHSALIEPFADFIRRYQWQAALILSLIAIYRISDVVMGIMANPFYVDMGFTKDEVATVSKIYGVVMTLVGAFVGGVLSMRLGVMRVLMLGAVLSAASNLLFAWLATPRPRPHGADRWWCRPTTWPAASRRPPSSPTCRA